MSVTLPKGYSPKGYKTKFRKLRYSISTSIISKKIFPIIFVAGILGSVIFGFTYVLLTPETVSQADPEFIFGGAIGIGIMGLIGLSFGVVLFFSGFRNMKKKKLMLSTPTSKIRSLAIGIAEIYGKVVPGKSGMMKSPFSNRDCVGAKIIVEEPGGGEGDWAVVKKIVLGNEFFLQDDTGKVLVDLGGAELDIPASYVFGSGPRADPPPNIVTFLKKHNFNFESLWGNKTLRYSESIIKPGDELYILGRADDNPNFRDGDANHGVQDLMMQQSHNPNIYFISARSEKQILGKMNKKTTAQIFGGLLLIGGSLLLIAIMFEPILSLMMVLGINR